MLKLFFNCTSELGHFSVDITYLKKVLFRCVKITTRRWCAVCKFCNVFDIFLGFHGDTVSCKIHHDSSVGFLELIIFNKADICLFFSSSSPFNIAVWSISPWRVPLFVKLGPLFTKKSDLCCNKMSISFFTSAKTLFWIL